MSAPNVFNCFPQDVGRGLHNLNADTLKVLLTNSPPVAANAVLSDITQIAGGTGYTTDGAQATANSFVQTSGVGKLTAANVSWTATGTMGPFRYAVLYNSTASAKNLIGWWDYGSSITLASTQTFTVAFDQTNGVMTVS